MVEYDFSSWAMAFVKKPWTKQMAKISNLFQLVEDKYAQCFKMIYRSSVFNINSFKGLLMNVYHIVVRAFKIASLFIERNGFTL